MAFMRILSPNKAPPVFFLDGSTDANGDSSVVLSLQNFPQISGPQDIQISFGDQICDGMNCSIDNIQSIAGVTILTVSVPPSRTPGTINLSAIFMGEAAPPLGGDPSTSYVRSTRSASVPFSYLFPLMSVSSARFCMDSVGMGHNHCSILWTFLELEL